MTLVNYDDLILQEHFFALEISDLKIKILKSRLSFRKLHVVGYNEAELNLSLYKNGIIQDPQAVGKIIRGLVTHATPKRIKDRYVSVVLPDDRVFLSVVSFPKDLSKQELQEAVEYKVKDLIPLPLDKVYWDWHRFPDQPESSEREVVISAVDKESAESYIEALHAADLQPLYFDISGNAAVRYLFKNDDSRKALLVRVDRYTSTISLFLNGGIRYQTILNEGHESILPVVALEMKITPEEAQASFSAFLNGEETDKNFQQQLGKVLVNTFPKLSKGIQKTFDYYIQNDSTGSSKATQSGNDKKKKEEEFPLEVYMFGKGAYLMQLKNSIDPNPFKVRQFNRDTAGIASSVALFRRQRLPENVILIGASIRNHGPYRKLHDTNLIPNTVKNIYMDHAIYKSIFLYMRFLSWGLGIVLIMILTMYFYIGQFKEQTQKEYETTLAFAESKRNNELDSEITYVNQNSTYLNNLYNQQVDWDVFFNELEDIQGSGITINSLLLSKDASAWQSLTNGELGKESIYNYYLIINGTASNREALLTYKDNLENSPLLTDVRFPITNFEGQQDVDFSVYVVVDSQLFILKTLNAEVSK